MRRILIYGVAVLAGVWITGSALAASVDRIVVAVPAHVTQSTVYDVTIRGFAGKRATAYLFLDYAGCAKSFTTEHHRAAKASYAYVVKGRFAKVSGWKSSTPGLDHACAYLIEHGSGKLLARARDTFTIH